MTMKDLGFSLWRSLRKLASDFFAAINAPMPIDVESWYASTGRERKSSESGGEATDAADNAVRIRCWIIYGNHSTVIDHDIHWP